jgi:hypothetical protein
VTPTPTAYATWTPTGSPTPTCLITPIATLNAAGIPAYGWGESNNESPCQQGVNDVCAIVTPYPYTIGNGQSANFVGYLSTVGSGNDDVDYYWVNWSMCYSYRQHINIYALPGDNYTVSIESCAGVTSGGTLFKVSATSGAPGPYYLRVWCAGTMTPTPTHSYTATRTPSPTRTPTPTPTPT